MDITKLLWMLQHKALFFARSDTLGDPYEGHYTRSFSTARDAFIKYMTQEFPELKPHDENFEKVQGENFERMLSAVKSSKQEYFVNCWHLNEFESAAMWKLYTSTEDAVCVKSVYSQLLNALPDNTRMGMVKYIDYERDLIDFGNSFNYLMHKRESFAHEREARAVLWRVEEKTKSLPFVEGGIKLAVDLTVIVKEVYVSPRARPPLLEVVTQLLKDFGLDVAVKQSEVNAPPAY